MTNEQLKLKTPKERDSLDLLELVCQLHSRALNYPSKEMHNTYREARNELESRLQKQQEEKHDVIKFAVWLDKNYGISDYDGFELTVKDLFVKYIITQNR